MKNLNKILAVSLIAMIGFASCSKVDVTDPIAGKSDGSDNPTVVQLKKGMEDDAQDFEEAEGTKGAMSVFETMNEVKLIDTNATTTGKRIATLSASLDARFETMFPGSTKELETKNQVFGVHGNIVGFLQKHSKYSGKTEASALDVDFANAHGIYRFNVGTDAYDKISDNYNGMLLQFPADKTNHPSIYDGELIISELSGVEVTLNGVTQDLPASFEMNVYISNVRVAGLMFDVAYGNDDIPIVGLGLSIYLKPFSFNLNYSYTPTLINIGMSLSNENSAVEIFSGELSAVMVGEEPQSMSGYAQYRNLKAIYDVDNPGNASITSANFETYVNVDFYDYPQNTYVGTLIMNSANELVIRTVTGDVLISDLTADIGNGNGTTP